ncbi:unnamed protein product, partial [Vitis vinifera]|uniref:Uncharacterized protein n=1 Tax=Vitis vinifera TaxID=29760 RepID=D7T4T2_VITVI
MYILSYTVNISNLNFNRCQFNDLDFWVIN